MMIKSKPRDHKIDIRYKKVRQYRVERKFFQEHSIFKDWIAPDYRKMLERDLENSKIGKEGKFIRDPEVWKRTFEVLYSHIHLLLDHFYWMIGRAGVENFPTITWLQFSELMVRMQICGDAEKSLAFHDVDLLIYTVCGPIKDIKPDKQLCRHEFWEILVRLSKVKFIEKPAHPSKRA